MRILLCGCQGRMGHAVADAVKGGEVIAAGVDALWSERAFPVYATPADCTEAVDVLIDFSNPAALDGVLTYAVENNVPTVICTTGLSNEQHHAIFDASRRVPVFFSGNMSLGIGLLTVLTKKAAAVLGEDFDIEILEMHHNQKLDAPSGTALMLADAAKAGLAYEPEYVYTRHDRREKRGDKEIGISAIRGGNIIGEHQVIFAGKDEVINLTHRAQSRALFATGALRAARFLIGKPAGLYNMEDLLADVL